MFQNFDLGPKNGKKQTNSDFQNRESKDSQKRQKIGKIQEIKTLKFFEILNFQVLILKIPTFLVKHPNTFIHSKPIFHYFEIVMGLLNQQSQEIIQERQSSNTLFEARDWNFLIL